jgi:uncharacterized membrane protein YedE/YeeE
MRFLFPIVWLQRSAAVSIALLLVIASLQLANNYERELSLSLILGGLFGFLLQRSKFCFFCITRDFVEERNSFGLLGLIAALAVGLLGYTAVYGAILPTPVEGRLPPDAHIGPVSWVLAAAALVFGVGMSLSGSCISAHLYRLGEGAFASIFALLGVLLGFVLGFQTWNSLYLGFIQDAPVIWLPHHLGYGGALIAQLGLLTVSAVFLLKYHRGTNNTDSSNLSAAKRNSSNNPPAHSLVNTLFTGRWPTYIGGILVGFLATIAYFRIAPLGVTAELGSIARTLGSSIELIPLRLEGLDGFSGCATVVKDALLSVNGVFILGLVFAAFAAALSSNQFAPELASPAKSLRNFVGGVLMGWASMTALGCTVGTLLSGIMAGALSGWIFAVFCVLGLWLTLKLRQRIRWLQ